MQKRKGNPGFLNPKTATANILLLSQENCLDGKVDETWKQAPQREDFGHGSSHHLGSVVWLLP